uniref:Kinesin motor family protein n=1 Tax=Rhizophora mucronata TaxID=61149 RepID=A0A2P2MQ09_RHIMU
MVVYRIRVQYMDHCLLYSLIDFFFFLFFLDRTLDVNEEIESRFFYKEVTR